MRKTSYPSRLEPRLKRAIIELDLMTEEELARARNRWRREHRSFRWPEFLAEGNGAFSGPWNPPDVAGFTRWAVERAHHYGYDLHSELSGGPEAGSVRFSTPGGSSEEAVWKRPARAYRSLEGALVTLWARDAIPLRLDKLEPRGEEFEWVIIRAGDLEGFEMHLKGEREWHSELSQSYQRFREAADSGDEPARLKAAVAGARAGEMMRGLGADYTFHSHHVMEMYGALGKTQDAARWSRYPHREHPRGM
jgi:hypothetical protein